VKRSTGTPLCLVPGMGNMPVLWSEQCEALAGDYDVIVADFRGSRSIGEMTDRVLASLGEGKNSLAGFSLGGYVALDLYRRFPDRVERLALVSSSPFADDANARQQRLRLIDKAGEDYPALLEDMARLIVSPVGERAANAREGVISMGLKLGAKEFCRQQLAAMDRSDCRRLLGSVRVPVTVLCGERDMITPVSANRYIAEQVPGATLEIVENAGHLLPLECPERVTAFLRNWMSHRDTPHERVPK